MSDSFKGQYRGQRIAIRPTIFAEARTEEMIPDLTRIYYVDGIFSDGDVLYREQE